LRCAGFRPVAILWARDVQFVRASLVQVSWACALGGVVGERTCAWPLAGLWVTLLSLISGPSSLHGPLVCGSVWNAGAFSSF
jgi:hypothetical protein